MCPPGLMAAAMLATSVASAGMGYIGQAQAAAAQARTNQAARESALQSATLQYRSINERIQQERVAAAQENMKISMESSQARSRARVAAGEAGVTGISPSLLLQDIDAAASRNIGINRSNLAWSENQADLQKQGVRSQLQGRVAQLPTPRPPSMINTGLQIVSGGVGAYDAYRRWSD